VSLIAAACCLALVGGLVPGVAAEGPSTRVWAAKREDGTLFTTPAYRALVGTDGNLHSLRVGDVEMLDDRTGISRGAFFYSDAALALPQVNVPNRATLEATDGVHSIRYRFEAQQATVTLSNGGSSPISYFVVLSSEISIVQNVQTGEAAASPAKVAWPEVSFFTRHGQYLRLRGGDRSWGPWLDRQVWEVAKIAPGGQVQFVFEAGVGEQPKATLEQLIGVKATVVAPEGGRLPRQGIELNAEVENRADEAMEGQVSMELSASRSELVLLSSAPLSLPAKQTVQMPFRARVEEPDFYTARITVTMKGRPAAKTVAVAGYRVDEILPVVTRPPDLQEFWQRLVAEAHASEPDLQLTPDEARSSSAGVQVSLASYAGLGGRTISGWYLAPPVPGKHPAILYLSGYGAPQIPPPVFLAQQGYVVLAIDVRGNAMNRPRVKSYDDYGTVGLESPDTYVYREIVGQVLRGLSAVARREEADPGRLAIVGVSEGGGLGLLAAALDPRVRAVSADAPMLADFPLSLRRAAWPYKRINQYLSEHAEQGEQINRTLSYFDLVNFAPEVKCPTLVSVGFLDQVSLPAAVYGMYNVLGGPKEMHAFPRAGHEGGGQDWWSYKLTWLAKQLTPQAQPPSPPQVQPQPQLPPQPTQPEPQPGPQPQV
jgi:cephalosporin-C deacetylase